VNFAERNTSIILNQAENVFPPEGAPLGHGMWHIITIKRPNQRDPRSGIFGIEFMELFQE
jgi:hypothetical protein